MRNAIATALTVTVFLINASDLHAQAWSIMAPVVGYEIMDDYDLQAWGNAPIGATIRVEIWREGTKIDEQIIGPLPSEPSSGGGGGGWWANFTPPSGGWNTTYYSNQNGEIKLYNQPNNQLMDSDSFIFTP